MLTSTIQIAAAAGRPNGAHHGRFVLGPQVCLYRCCGPDTKVASAGALKSLLLVKMYPRVIALFDPRVP